MGNESIELGPEVAPTKHGETAHHRFVRVVAYDFREIDGEHVGFPVAAYTETVCSRYCARCGWVEIHGVLGAVKWKMAHRYCEDDLRFEEEETLSEVIG